MYDVMMIDPPWPVRKGGKRKVRPRQGRSLDYSTLTIPVIFTLLDGEVLPLLSPTGTVFLWVVDKVLIDAESVMVKRGFRRHARIVWNKTNGIAPAFSVRFSHEYLLWFYRPPFQAVAEEARGRWKTVIREKARQHSRKPDVAYRMVDELYPGFRKLDVFSREKRDGWDQWGDQANWFGRES